VCVGRRGFNCKGNLAECIIHGGYLSYRPIIGISWFWNGKKMVKNYNTRTAYYITAQQYNMHILYFITDISKPPIGFTETLSIGLRRFWISIVGSRDVFLGTHFILLTQIMLTYYDINDGSRLFFCCIGACLILLSPYAHRLLSINNHKTTPIFVKLKKKKNHTAHVFFYSIDIGRVGVRVLVRGGGGYCEQFLKNLRTRLNSLRVFRNPCCTSAFL